MRNFPFLLFISSFSTGNVRHQCDAMDLKRHMNERSMKSRIRGKKQERRRPNTDNDKTLYRGWILLCET